MPTGLL